MNKIMVLKGGSPAIHKLGDIGRDEDDYIRVHKETATHYIGSFEEGYGFIDVEFKKEDCRLLTQSEIDDLNGKWYTINGTPLYKIYVDKEGNVIKGKCIMKKGTINRVTDAEGKDKPSDFVGMNIEFAEDIQIGQSLVMFVEDGRYITTSEVINVVVIDAKGKVNYIVSTKNSVYCISL